MSNTVAAIGAFVGVLLVALLSAALSAGLVALWVAFWVWVTPWSWMEVSIFMILVSVGQASYNTSKLVR